MILEGPCVVFDCSLNGLELARRVLVFNIKADNCGVILTFLLQGGLEVEAVLYGGVAVCDVRQIE